MKRLLFILYIQSCIICPLSAQKKQSGHTQKIIKVGLVLGGGGAKGAAEIGVLKYIEEVGIPIDYIAGTSIGSIIGGLYSVGYRSSELDSLFHNQVWLNLLADRNQEVKGNPIWSKNGVTYVFGFPVHRSPKNKANNNADKANGVNKKDNHTKTIGLMQGNNVIALLDSMTGRLGDISFDKLPIPFHCVAVDIRTFKEVELSSGSLPLAMRSSMAIPGIFKPIERDSMLLVDGGLLNNLPVDVVKRMGADVIIAIDLTQNKRDAKDDYNMAAGKTINRLLNWLIKRPDLKKYNENVNAATIYINPDLKGYSASSFNAKKIDRMIKQGEKAGKKAEKELKELMKNIWM